MFNIWCLVISGALGALLNRIRGGLRIPKTDKKFPACKLWQPVIYGLVLGFFNQTPTPTWLFAILNGAFMYLGQQIFGWGDYVGELTTGKKSGRNEVPFIDTIIQHISSPRIWGFCGLTIRGFFWTLWLGLPYLFINPLNASLLMLSGFLMGFVYFLATMVKQANDTDQDKNAWNLAEWLWGAVLWLITIACLGVYYV